MSLALVVVSDGRHDYYERTMASAAEMLPDAFDHTITIDDSDHKLGFAGAVQAGFDAVLSTDAKYAFWLEADFTFNRPIPLGAMTEVLDAHEYLVQMALLRQPWNDAERKAGGIVQQHPDEYEPVGWGAYRWLEHRRFVTTNPSVWPRWVLERGWPQRDQSEGHFGVDLFASHPALRAAFWGAGDEWVEHIGDVRAGTGY